MWEPVSSRDGQGDDDETMEIELHSFRNNDRSNDLEQGGRDDGGAATFKAGNSSIALAVFNFTNSIVGAGLIGIPYAIQQCGFLIGVIMIFCIAYIIHYSVVTLIDCGIKVGCMDLEELAGKVMGRRGYYFASLFMFVFSYGAQIAYMVIIGDTMPKVLQTLFQLEDVDRNSVIIGVAVCVVLPLCLLKDISSLSYAACISIVSDVILVTIVCIRGPEMEKAEGINMHNGDFELTNAALFAGIGAMSFTFVCQHNSFMIYQSLKEPSRENWGKVATYSLLIAVVVCLAMGLAGYLSFFDTVHGDILNNFSDNDNFANVGRGLLAVSMMMTYPMECYVSKHCIMSVFFRKSAGEQAGHGDRDRDIDVSMGSEAGEGSGSGNGSGASGLKNLLRKATTKAVGKIKGAMKGAAAGTDKGDVSSGKANYNVLPVFVIDEDEDGDCDGDAAAGSPERASGGTPELRLGANGREASPAITGTKQRGSKSPSKGRAQKGQQHTDVGGSKSSSNSSSRHSRRDLHVSIPTGHSPRASLEDDSRSGHSGGSGDMQEIVLNTPHRSRNSSFDTEDGAAAGGGGHLLYGALVAALGPLSQWGGGGGEEDDGDDDDDMAGINNNASSSSSSGGDVEGGGGDFISRMRRWVRRQAARCLHYCTSQAQSQDGEETARVAVTVTLWVVVVTIAVCFAHVGMVLSLTGSVGASMVGFVLPACIHYCTYKDDFDAIWEAHAGPLVHHWHCMFPPAGGDRTALPTASPLASPANGSNNDQSGSAGSFESFVNSKPGTSTDIPEDDGGDDEGDVGLSSISASGTHAALQSIAQMHRGSLRPITGSGSRGTVNQWLNLLIYTARFVLAFRQFYFAMFSFVFGCALMVFGVFTVLLSSGGDTATVA